MDKHREVRLREAMLRVERLWQHLLSFLTRTESGAEVKPPLPRRKRGEHQLISGNQPTNHSHHTASRQPPYYCSILNSPPRRSDTLVTGLILVVKDGKAHFLSQGGCLLFTRPLCTASKSVSLGAVQHRRRKFLSDHCNRCCLVAGQIQIGGVSCEWPSLRE